MVQSFTSKNVSPMSGVWSGNRDSSDRPTMPRMIRSSSTAPSRTSRVSTVLPSRMMVIASEMASISLSLWLIMMQVMPRDWSPRIRSRRWRESSSLSAAVGSSRMRSLTSLLSALAISTSCCLPTPMFLIGVSGSSTRPTRASRSRARLLVATQSMTPRLVSSLPRKMFSAIDSSGMRASSWWMMTMPACSESRMLLNSTGLPLKVMVPS